MKRLGKFSRALVMLLPALFAQSGTTLDLGGVNSSYSLGTPTFGSMQYAVTVSIEYNTGLTASSYISPAQLTSDFQGFLNTYPNPGDPPEAILLFAAQGFAQQSSQFNVVMLDATVGSAAALQAEIEVTASNIQVGALDRQTKMRKAAKAAR
jgi:hypothetical protein